MPVETIRTPPRMDDFMPLEEYLSHTPDSFFGGKPVLHFHASDAKAALMGSGSGVSLPIFPGSEAEQTVDVFVNSENLTLFSPSAQVGIQIPYPAISIHAIKSASSTEDSTKDSTPSLMLQIAFPSADEEEFNTVELTIIPPTITESASAQEVVKKLYDAVSACSSLHPDPADDEDEDEDEDYADKIIFEGDVAHEALDGFTGVFQGTRNGGLPPPMPGSSGWITAENVHEYFDEEGNWIRDAGAGEDEVEDVLGDGAGTVRARDESRETELNGHGEEGEGETKKPRLE